MLVEANRRIVSAFLLELTIVAAAKPASIALPGYFYDGTFLVQRSKFSFDMLAF